MLCLFIHVGTLRFCQRYAVAITDFDSYTCVSPFSPGCPVFYVNFNAHQPTPLEFMKVVAITKVSCNDPLTVVGLLGYNGTIGTDSIIYHQCALSSETPYVDTSNHCKFACSCLGSCEGIFLHQEIFPWRDDNPNEYRTCDVKIVP